LLFEILGRMTQASGDRVLAILDLFSEDRLVWTPQAMMAATGYTRPTLYRYLKTLRAAGFLAPVPGGGFAIGPRVVELDFLMRKSDRLIAGAEAELHDLAARFPGTAFLAEWYGERLLCVASSSRDIAARTSYPRGRPMPLARGAASRAIIAHLPKRQQQRFLDHEADLRQVRRDGVAVAHGEVTRGIVGTAAPVLDEGGRPLASLCVSMEAEDYARIVPADLAEAIIAAAAQIMARLSDGLNLDRTG